MYSNDILKNDNLIELFCDLLTNEHPNSYTLC